jgi:LacI family transcriptional regulator
MSKASSKPTIADVAAAANVSVPTVSRVLNERYGVAPATAERVRQVIKDLGYESNLAARSMRGSQTSVIGLIVPDMDHSYAIEVIKGVSRAVTGTEYDLIAMTTGRKDWQEQGRWEQQQVRRVNGSIVDGIILVAPSTDGFRSDYPLVAVDPYRHSDALPAVIAANREGALSAMRYLMDLGHRRIGHVRGLPYLQSTERRQQGYEDALGGLAIALDMDLIVECDFTRAGGLAAGRRLLSLPAPPTAIFAANDDSAFGVMDAAREAGLVIPRDLSVVGFDNVPDSITSDPALTTVDQAIKVMGEAAAKMLIQLMEGETLSSQLAKIPTQLVIRDSCCRTAERGN